MRKLWSIFLITCISLVFSLPLLLNVSKAASLGETFLFLERMRTEQSTDMILLVTPSTTFNTGDRSLKITFPGSLGLWCKTNNTTLTVSGASTSAIDLGDWVIDASLPGTLVGTCYQHAGGDYIEVTGVGTLTAGNSYGLKIASHAQFKTGTTVGNNIISVQLIEGVKIESITFGINLLSNDQVVVTAEVAAADTISCTLSTNSVNLGTLFRGGIYITGSHNLSATSTSGFYWAVYGTGDGSTSAGLYKSSETSYLISSAGTGGIVNLITGGEGFGMALTTSAGLIMPNYVSSTPGVFGAIGRTFSNANLILASDVTGEVNSTVILGAKASTSAQDGSYQETLTYVCGGYIGGGTESELYSCSEIEVGEECGGGIVAYHDGEGGGLIALSTDSSTSIQWGCRGQSVGTTSEAIGTGLANTNTIVNFHNNPSNFNSEDYYTFGGDYSTIGCNVSNNGTVAAKVCADLSSGGYDDWFLPSRNELNALFCHIGSTGTETYWDDVSHANCTQYPDFSSTLDANGNIGSFAAATYWSSSENNTLTAWRQSFNDGFQANLNKTTTTRVRCIRAF